MMPKAARKQTQTRLVIEHDTNHEIQYEALGRGGGLVGWWVGGLVGWWVGGLVG